MKRLLPRFQITLLCTVSIFLSGRAVAEPVKSTPAAICKSLSGNEVPAFVWLDSKGNPIGNTFNLGEIDKSAETGGEEYVPASEHFYLIMAPAQITVSSDCSLSHCIDIVKVPARCPRTSEFHVTMKMLPWKFGPGPFEMEARLVPEDPRSYYPLDIDVLSGRPLIGTISMPWFDIRPIDDEQSAFPKDKAQQEATVRYAIRNVGNRPVELRPWERYDGSMPGIELVENACSNTILAPGSSCRLAFRIQPAQAMPGKYATWGASSVDGRVHLVLDGSLDENWELHVSTRIQ